MTREELAGRIDHTVLRAEATEAEVRRACGEAREFGFASVCVSPCFVGVAKRELAGSLVKVCTVSGFPSGTSKPVIKAIESSSAVKDGAQEVDVVAHLPFLAAGKLEAARAELTEVVKACRAANPETVVKVIVESAYLMTLGKQPAGAEGNGSSAAGGGEGWGEKAIELACRAVRESGCDFIKTSTGFHPAGGATVAAVRLMRQHGGGLKIKAAGGIRDLATAEAMLAAGADRLGMSASVAIVQGLTGAANY